MTRRLIRLLLAALLAFCVPLSLLHLILRKADGLPERWAQVGLPGELASGNRASLPLAWPPRVVWRDLSLDTPRTGQITCERLEIVMRGSQILRGRLRAASVRLEGVEIESNPMLSRTIGLLLSCGAPRPLQAPPAPHPGAVRLSVSGLRSSPPDKERRMEGWGWLPHQSAWALRGVVGEKTRGVVLSARGEGSGGKREASIDLDFGAPAHLQLSWRAPAEGIEKWRLAGRDDGRLVEAILDSLGIEASSTIEGQIDFDLAREAGSPWEGEVRLESVAIRPFGGGRWTASGLVCLSDGGATLQDLSLEHGSGSVALSATLDAPTPGGRAGRFHAEGPLRDERWGISGEILLHGRHLVIRAPSVDLGAVRSGPFDASWTLDGAASQGAPGDSLRIRLRFEEGSLQVRGAPMRGRSPLFVEVRSMPLRAVDPWLAAALPGTWDGILDGSGTIEAVGSGWRGRGEATIREGRVSGLPILEEIGMFRGGRDWSAARFNKARATWLLAGGALLAESLRVETSALAVTGTLYRAPSDSLLGLLRVTPAGRKGLASILLLLGGREDRLDLAVTGKADNPELTPLSERAWGRIEDRLLGVREDMERGGISPR